MKASRANLRAGYLFVTIVVLSTIHPLSRELNLYPESWLRTLTKYVSLSVLVSFVAIFLVPLVSRLILGSDFEPTLGGSVVKGLITLLVLSVGSTTLGTSSLLMHGGLFAYPFFAEWGFVRFSILTGPILSIFAVAYFICLNRMTRPG